MSNNGSWITDAQERAVQQKRKRRLQENRAIEQQRKIDARRRMILGSIFEKHLPDVSHFQPKLNEADNNVEFAALEDFISAVARDKGYAALFQEIISQKLSMESQ